MANVLNSAKATGRIRDEDNKPAHAYKVTTYVELRGLRVKVGSTETDQNGGFEILFSPHDHGAQKDEELMLSIQVEDKEGKVVIDTPSKKNTTGRIDFQIRLRREPLIKDELDIYSGGMSRLVSSYSSLDKSIDPSRGDVRKSLESLVDVVKRWDEYRDELARSCGLEVIQVPRYPRKEEHYHVSRWDEAVLPTS